jgi:hypothetical protein
MTVMRRADNTFRTFTIIAIVSALAGCVRVSAEQVVPPGKYAMVEADDVRVFSGPAELTERGCRAGAPARRIAGATECFPRGVPQPPVVPSAVWISKPKTGPTGLSGGKPVENDARGCPTGDDRDGGRIRLPWFSAAGAGGGRMVKQAAGVSVVAGHYRVSHSG